MKRRKDGRFYKRILVGHKDDGTKKYVNIYGKTEKEVEEKERKIRMKLDSGILFCDDITVKEWAELWVEKFKIGITEGSRARYRQLINCHIVPKIGDVPINKVTYSMIQKLITELSFIRAAETVRKTKNALNQMFYRAILERYIVCNPVEGVELPQIIKIEKEIIPEDEQRRLEEFCEGYEHGALIMTLLYTGLRRGELLALTPKDVDFKNEYIYVNKAVEFISNIAYIKPPKTPMSNRSIPILEPIIPYLKQQISKCNKYLFENKEGKMYTRTQIEYLFRKFRKDYNKYINRNKSEFEEQEDVKYTMHQFRHTFCTMLYMAEIDLKTTQSIMGHSSPMVTLAIYTHLDKKYKKLKIKKLKEYVKRQSNDSQAAI